MTPSTVTLLNSPAESPSDALTEVLRTGARTLPGRPLTPRSRLSWPPTKHRSPTRAAAAASGMATGPSAPS